jgi:hypothetical protein
MTIAGAAVHKAVASLWISSGLNTLFQAYWAVADRSLYTSLNDGEAAPGTPFPYAVFTARASNIKTRMSGDGAASKQHINDQPWTFEVYVGPNGSYSAKEFASLMVEEVMKVFGGHPTQSPSAFPALDHGQVLIVQYQNDWGEREDDDVHKWTVEYNIRTDVPVVV